MGEYQVTDGASTGNTLDIALEDSYGRTRGRSLDFTMKDPIEQLVSEEAVFQDSRSSLLRRGLQDDLTVDAFTFILLVDRLSETLGVSEEDAYSILKQVDESVGLNDVFSREADYFRGLAANFSLNDFKALTAQRTVSEDLVLNEVEDILTVLDLNEDLVFTDVYSDEASFFKSLNEDLVLNEFVQDARTFFTTVSEQVVFNDVYSREASYFRVYSEDLLLSEVDTKKVVKPVSEQVTLNESYSRVGEFFRTQSEQLQLADVQNATRVFFRFLAETLAFDTFAEIKAVIKASETLSVSDVYSREAGYFRDYSEDAVFQDTLAFLLEKDLLDEALGLDDSNAFTLSRTEAEDLTLDEALAKTVLTAKSEGLDLNDSVAKNVLKLLEAGVVLDEQTSYEIKKVVEARAAISDVYSREAQYFRDYSETVVFDEAFSERRIIFQSVAEGLKLDEQINRLFNRPLTEELTVFHDIDLFFSEGPGSPPYYLKNSFFQKNKVRNSFFESNKVKNAFSSFNLSASYGSKDQS